MIVTCPVCGKSFKQYNKKHAYDCRRCFKKAYDMREKMERDEEDKHFPLFRCQVCGEETRLTFNVKKNLLAWSGFRCPKCGLRNNVNY